MRGKSDIRKKEQDPEKPTLSRGRHRKATDLRKEDSRAAEGEKALTQPGCLCMAEAHKRKSKMVVLQKDRVAASENSSGEKFPGHPPLQRHCPGLCKSRGDLPVRASRKVFASRGDDP
jgi:hypothetical protein